VAENSTPSIQIDLNEFKLHLHLKNNSPLTLHFDSPSRRFYLSLIALVVMEMKKSGKIRSVPLQDHFDLLVLLNESIGGAAGSSNKKSLMYRIYIKWRNVLPNLEEAPLFKILGKRKGEAEGAIRKIYPFSEVEKDSWANLFEYRGSEENVRLKFAIDRVGANLDDIVILFEDSLNEAAWERFLSSLDRKPEQTERASLEKMAFPLSENPSIAVLPFVNLSGDPTQEFLSDGITENIITALSKSPELFVIARNSTFTYKGKAIKVKQVSEELGVRYVLEGSVQRAGDRVRIAAQLIDVLSGYHLWAERYDRDLKDLFSLQDEVTLKILMALQVKLTEGEQALFFGKMFKGKQDLECYLKFYEANNYLRKFTVEDNSKARRIAEEMVAKWPEDPLGYTILGWTHLTDFGFGSTKSPQESFEKAFKLAQKAQALDDSIAWVHNLLCAIYNNKREYDKAIAEGERAVALEPNGANAHYAYASGLHYAGRLKEAIPVYQKAIRLSPRGFPMIYHMLGFAYILASQFEEAVLTLKTALSQSPNLILSHIGLVSAYMAMGKEKEARAEVAEVKRINPMFALEHYAKALCSPWNYNYPSVINEHIARLRKAGLK
jgi:adenylate cyclase